MAREGDIMVAARVGALMPEPFSTLGASYLVGLEGGWVAPVWKRRLAVALELGFGMPQADGSVPADSSVRWHAEVRELTLGVSLELRQSWGRFMPYLRAGPRLCVVDSVVNGHDGESRLPTSQETTSALGLGITPGVGLTLPPGQLFVELPIALLWRVGAIPRLTGDFNPSSLAFAAGYRVFF